MTTVGYGDVALTTQGARLVAFFHILVSVYAASLCAPRAAAASS